MTVPGQVLTTFGVAAISTFPGAVGKLSVKIEVSVIGDALSFVKKIVRVEIPPEAITAGENCLLTTGGLAIVICALVGSSLVTPSKVLMLLVAIVSV